MCVQGAPGTGKTAVSQVTVAELTGADGATGEDAGEVARVKRDARMAEVCERAVWRQLGSVEQDVVVPHAGTGWTLEVDAVTEAVRRGRTVGRTWTAGRKAFEQAALQAFLRRAEQRTGRAKEATWAKEFAQQPVFTAFVDHVWPRLTAKQVLRRLYEDPEFREMVCAGVLTPEETALLRRGKGAFKASTADVLLLDELEAHVGRSQAPGTYGHLVVDEAQDLSPMECRAIARRCPTGAMTVLGDLAQGTTPWAASDWTTQMAHLDRAEATHTEITAGYRVPAVIIELANRVLAHLDVTVSPARSVRTDGSVDVTACQDLTRGAVQAVEKALVENGMVGVIGTDETLEQLRAELPPSERVELVPARLAHGLEFDHVVLVEPTDVVGDSRDVGDDESWDAAGRQLGLRHLYVALTRAVSRLTVVHGGALPPELGEV